MPKAELLQTAAQVAGQARELFDAGARTNLLQNLTQLGHPYVLLLGQDPTSSCWTEESSFHQSSTPLVNLKFKGLDHNKQNEGGRWKLAQKVPSQLSSLGYFSSMYSVGHKESFNSSGLRLSDDEVGSTSKRNANFKDNSKWVAAITLLGGVLSSRSYDKIQENQNVFFFVPLFLKNLTKDFLLERSRELKINKNSVSLGTTAIKLTTYQGEQPFVVRTPQGEPIAQINQGDQLGHLHVSHQASFMRALSVIEKTRQITGDFIDLLKIITTGEANLKTEQHDVLAKAQNATLIGISHLVPLFRLKTGLPTWKLDVLPDLIQRFHQHDSQAVSKAFGGTRKVKPGDVEMMVVTPQMRQQLVAQSL